MSLIRSHGNRTTELRFIRILRSVSIYGWRRNQNLLGKPDFVFHRHKMVVFVDGCFWHGCGKCYRRPTSNQAFWDQKLITNRCRDRRVSRELRLQGWRVIRIWEHQLREPKRVVARLRRTLTHIGNNSVI